jgi:hypothetical protein
LGVRSAAMISISREISREGFMCEAVLAEAYQPGPFEGTKGRARPTGMGRAPKR